MGLAAFLQWWQRFKPNQSPNLRNHVAAIYSRKFILFVAASLATSLVAGTLSGIPAAHHFGRLAPYGVIANAMALPIVSFIVMPAAMASVLFMPLGLEGVPLQIMGWGLQVVMWVSDWVASWPGAGLRLPLLQKSVAVPLALAVVFLLLPLGRMRLLAVPFVLVAATYHFLGHEKPLLLVDERAGNVAVWTEQGLVPAHPKQAAATVSRWLTQAGDSGGFKKAQLRTAWACSTTMCETMQSNVKIAYLLKQANGNWICPSADILVSQEPLRRRCKGRLATVDRFDVWRNGAFAVSATGKIAHSKGEQGSRPWVYEPRARLKP
jgi:competence protein ComEC